MTKLIVGGLAALAIAGPLLGAGTASADANDALYLQLRNAHGFNISNTYDAINHAHWVCDELSYRSGDSVINEVYDNVAEYTWNDAVYKVSDAVTAYCPWQW